MIGQVTWEGQGPVRVVTIVTEIRQGGQGKNRCSVAVISVIPRLKNAKFPIFLEISIQNFDFFKAWMQRRRYKVSPRLEDEWRAQAHFFTKVILIKAAQLLVINLWLLTVLLRGYGQGQVKVK